MFAAASGNESTLAPVLRALKAMEAELDDAEHDLGIYILGQACL